MCRLVQSSLCSEGSVVQVMLCIDTIVDFGVDVPSQCLCTCVQSSIVTQEECPSNTYPISRVEELIDRLDGTKFKIMQDLAEVWSIPLDI